MKQVKRHVPLPCWRTGRILRARASYEHGAAALFYYVIGGGYAIVSSRYVSDVFGY